jgi:SSS family solute:Na+ symporter
VVGVFRMLVDTPVTMGLLKSYPEGSFFWIINNINFQYFSIIITIISAIVMVIFSYASPPPDYEKIKGLTYGTASEKDHTETLASWDKRDVLASAFILVCILGAYLYFRG